MAVKKKPLFGGFNLTPIELPKTNALGLPLPINQATIPALAPPRKRPKRERVKISRGRTSRSQPARSQPARLDTTPPPVPPVVTPVPKPEPMRIQRQESNPRIAKQVGRTTNDYRSSVVRNLKYQTGDTKFTTTDLGVSLPSTKRDKLSRTEAFSPVTWAQKFPEANAANITNFLAIRGYPASSIADAAKYIAGQGHLTAFEKYTMAEQWSKSKEFADPEATQEQEIINNSPIKFNDSRATKWVASVSSIAAGPTGGINSADMPDFLRMALAIIMQESNGDEKSSNVNPATGDDSHGLLQINLAGGQGIQVLEWFKGEADPRAAAIAWLEDPNNNLSLGLGPIAKAYLALKKQPDADKMSDQSRLAFVLANSGHPREDGNIEAIPLTSRIAFATWYERLGAPVGDIATRSSTTIDYSWKDIPQTLEFGSKEPPYENNPEGHLGTDWAVPWNTPLEAVVPGIVSVAGPNGGYGNMVEITFKMGDSEYKMRYAHLNSIAVEVGQEVTAGQNIGASGNTGYVVGTADPEHPGAHLHLELRKDGVPTDPLEFLNMGTIESTSMQPTLLNDVVDNWWNRALNAATLEAGKPPEAASPAVLDVAVGLEEAAGSPGDIPKESQFLLDVETEDPYKMEEYRKQLGSFVTPISEEDIDRILTETVKRPITPKEREQIKATILNGDEELRTYAFNAYDLFIRNKIREQMDSPGESLVGDFLGETSNVAEGLAATVFGPYAHFGTELRKKAGLPDVGALNLLLSIPAVIAAPLIMGVAPLAAPVAGLAGYVVPQTVDNPYLFDPEKSIPENWERNKEQYTKENLGEFVDWGPLHISPQTISYEMFHIENVVPAKWFAAPAQAMISKTRGFGERFLSGGRTATWYKRQAGTETWQKLGKILATVYPDRDLRSIQGHEVLALIDGSAPKELLDLVPPGLLDDVASIIIKPPRPGDKDIAILARSLGVSTPHYWHPLERAAIGNDLDNVLFDLAKKMDNVQKSYKGGGLGAGLKEELDKARSNAVLRIANTVSRGSMDDVTEAQFNYINDWVESKLRSSLKGSLTTAAESGGKAIVLPGAMGRATDIMAAVKRHTETVWDEIWLKHKSKIAQERNKVVQGMTDLGWNMSLKKAWTTAMEPFNVHHTRMILGFPGFPMGNVLEAQVNNAVYAGKNALKFGATDHTATDSLIELITSENLLPDLKGFLPSGLMIDQSADLVKRKAVAQAYYDALKTTGRYQELAKLLEVIANPDLDTSQKVWLNLKRRKKALKEGDIKEALFPQKRAPSETGLMAVPEALEEKVASRKGVFKEPGIKSGLETVFTGIEHATTASIWHKVNDVFGRRLRARFILESYHKELRKLAKEGLVAPSTLRSLLLREGLEEMPTGLPKWAKKQLAEYVRQNVGKVGAEDLFRNLDSFVSEGKILKSKLNEYISQKAPYMPEKVKQRFYSFSRARGTITRKELDDFIETELRPMMSSELLAQDLFLMPEYVQEAKVMVDTWNKRLGEPKTVTELLDYAKALEKYGDWIADFPGRINREGARYAARGDRASAELMWTELTKHVDDIKQLATTHRNLLEQVTGALRKEELHQYANQVDLQAELSAKIAEYWRLDREAIAGLKDKYGPEAFKYRDEWVTARSAVWDQFDVEMKTWKGKRVDPLVYAREVIDALKRQADQDGKMIPTLRELYRQAEKRGVLTPKETMASINQNFPGLYDRIFPKRNQMEKLLITENLDPNNKAKLADELGKMWRGEGDLSAYHAMEDRFQGTRDIGTVAESLHRKYRPKSIDDTPLVDIAYTDQGRLTEIGIELRTLSPNSIEAEIFDTVTKLEKKAKGEYTVKLTQGDVAYLKARGVDVTTLPGYRPGPTLSQPDLDSIRWKLGSGEPLGLPPTETIPTGPSLTERLTGTPGEPPPATMAETIPAEAVLPETPTSPLPDNFVALQGKISKITNKATGDQLDSMVSKFEDYISSLAPDSMVDNVVGDSADDLQRSLADIIDSVEERLGDRSDAVLESRLETLNDLNERLDSVISDLSDLTPETVMRTPVSEPLYVGPVAKSWKVEKDGQIIQGGFPTRQEAVDSVRDRGSGFTVRPEEWTSAPEPAPAEIPKVAVGPEVSDAAYGLEVLAPDPRSPNRGWRVQQRNSGEVADGFANEQEALQYIENVRGTESAVFPEIPPVEVIGPPPKLPASREAAVGPEVSDAATVSIPPQEVPITWPTEPGTSLLGTKLAKVVRTRRSDLLTAIKKIQNTISDENITNSKMFFDAPLEQLKVPTLDAPFGERLAYFIRLKHDKELASGLEQAGDILTFNRLKTVDGKVDEFMQEMHSAIEQVTKQPISDPKLKGELKAYGNRLADMQNKLTDAERNQLSTMKRKAFKNSLENVSRAYTNYSDGYALDMAMSKVFPWWQYASRAPLRTVELYTRTPFLLRGTLKFLETAEEGGYVPVPGNLGWAFAPAQGTQFSRPFQTLSNLVNRGIGWPKYGGVLGQAEQVVNAFQASGAYSPMMSNLISLGAAASDRDLKLGMDSYFGSTALQMLGDGASALTNRIPRFGIAKPAADLYNDVLEVLGDPYGEMKILMYYSRRGYSPSTVEAALTLNMNIIAREDGSGRVDPKILRQQAEDYNREVNFFFDMFGNVKSTDPGIKEFKKTLQGYLVKAIMTDPTLYKAWKAGNINPFTMNPKDILKMLPPALRRRVEDLPYGYIYDNANYSSVFNAPNTRERQQNMNAYFYWEQLERDRMLIEQSSDDAALAAGIKSAGGQGGIDHQTWMDQRKSRMEQFRGAQDAQRERLGVPATSAEWDRYNEQNGGTREELHPIRRAIDDYYSIAPNAVTKQYYTPDGQVDWAAIQDDRDALINSLPEAEAQAVLDEIQKYMTPTEKDFIRAIRQFQDFNELPRYEIPKGFPLKEGRVEEYLNDRETYSKITKNWKEHNGEWNKLSKDDQRDLVGGSIFYDKWGNEVSADQEWVKEVKVRGLLFKWRSFDPITGNWKNLLNNPPDSSRERKAFIGDERNQLFYDWFWNNPVYKPYLQDIIPEIDEATSLPGISVK